MHRRLAGYISGLALVVVSVVLAHELVYLARYGSRYNDLLGGLRLVTRGIVALAAAHTVADLALWWL